MVRAPHATVRGVFNTVKATSAADEAKAKAVSDELNQVAAAAEAEKKKPVCRSLWRGRDGSQTARSIKYGDEASLREYDQLGCDAIEWRTPTAGRRSRKLSTKFNRCVKSVRKTVKARPKSTKESAAIAICTKSVLQSRGRTLKRYRRGRLTTQRRR